MHAKVTKPVPLDTSVTLTLSVEEFRLLDAVQHFYLGGGTPACLAINKEFGIARRMLGVVVLPHIKKDVGFGPYFDAAAAQCAEAE